MIHGWGACRGQRGRSQNRNQDQSKQEAEIVAMHTSKENQNPGDVNARNDLICQSARECLGTHLAVCFQVRFFFFFSHVSISDMRFFFFKLKFDRICAF